MTEDSQFDRREENRPISLSKFPFFRVLFIATFTDILRVSPTCTDIYNNSPSFIHFSLTSYNFNSDNFFYIDSKAAVFTDIAQSYRVNALMSPERWPQLHLILFSFHFTESHRDLTERARS